MAGNRIPAAAAAAERTKPVAGSGKKTRKRNKTKGNKFAESLRRENFPQKRKSCNRNYGRDAGRDQSIPDT